MGIIRSPFDKNKFTWVIKDFSSLRSEMIYSDEFVLGGCKWRLMAYPDGDRIKKYMSLYVEVADSKHLPSGWSIHTELRMEVVNHHLYKPSQQKYRKNFWFDKKTPAWGYKTMIPHSKLCGEEGFLVNGEVTIVVQIDVYRVIGKVAAIEISEEGSKGGYEYESEEESKKKSVEGSKWGYEYESEEESKKESVEGYNGGYEYESEEESKKKSVEGSKWGYEYESEEESKKDSEEGYKGRYVYESEEESKKDSEKDCGEESEKGSEEGSSPLKKIKRNDDRVESNDSVNKTQHESEGGYEYESEEESKKDSENDCGEESEKDSEEGSRPLKKIKRNDDGVKSNDSVNKTQQLKETMDVNGFQVLPSQEKFVSRIFEKYPDIAVGFHAKNQHLRTACMNVLLSLIETLCQSPQELSNEDMVEADNALTYVKDAGFKVDWLEKKLEEVKEKKVVGHTGETRIQELEEEMLNIMCKWSDMKAVLEKEKTKVLAARAPLTLDDFV
ncbi:MATH domain and coiled-coil domain-containing protein At3g58220 isoform X1 [Arabidopsis lyrata subsp. lyrata]|uniref:MATH domain and coiled-coil domain-containing protein At3g58220 isoform X1 n=1 Tax=Arabidopsis lyrata subsp. lyrata TaxID=81972 RepID=UPI000A29A35D|nr:MATH domain and coiled-coil domain-containing protein At3g58220 isoform X1 [Arabidopsis lyrata subsp. lyrata]|eukprot:XP_020880519.1 MATH domain and coiled-coil domain-containing protein At3g58220 isoform X1 [Arabidopsis lyrata subsp. lyrata]